MRSLKKVIAIVFKTEPSLCTLHSVRYIGPALTSVDTQPCFAFSVVIFDLLPIRLGIGL